MGFGSVHVSHLPYQFRVYISGVFSKSSSFPTTILFCIALHVLFIAHSLRVVLDFLRLRTFFRCLSSRKSCRWTTCVPFSQSSLVCSFSLFSHYPAYPSLFLFHLIPCSILELDGSCWNTAFPSSEFPFTRFSLPTFSWEISWQVTIKPW